ALDLNFGGEACGEVHAGAMRAKWDDDQKNVNLVGVSLFSGEAERFTRAGLDPNVVTTAIAAAKIPVPIPPADLGAMLPDVAKSASDARATVSARVSSAVPES